MKVTLGSLLLAGALLITLPEVLRAQEAAAPPDDASQAAPAIVTLEVHGMVCDGCSARLEKKLKKTAGVESASVDLEAGRAEVVLKPGATITDEQFKKLVTAVGFHLVSVERGAKGAGA